MKKLLPLIAMAMMASACKSNAELIDAFTEDDGIRMEINGKSIFRFNPLNCQYATNADRTGIYLISDDGADYVSALFSNAPSRFGQELQAEIEWTEPMALNHKKDVALTVKKIKGDKFWLWSDALRLGIVFPSEE